jgi:hypothetical protein
MMMGREELIERLVTTGHLNVPDRRALGHVTRAEIHEAIRARLEKDGIFPPNARATGSVYEGAQLRCLDDGSFLAITQRASVHNPGIVAESTEHRFKDIGAAVAWYIDSEWAASIDGIAIK